MKEYTIINPAYTQLCEDIKNDPRFNITAEEASRRLAEALTIERESLKNIGISIRLLTLHDKWKYWESMGMDRKQFEGLPQTPRKYMALERGTMAAVNYRRNKPGRDKGYHLGTWRN